MNFVYFKRGSLVAILIATLCHSQFVLADDGLQAEAVRQSLTGLAQAFNSHDAAAFAANWTEGAVYADPANGVELTGREAILEHYATLFKEQPQVTLAAKITDIELKGNEQAFVRGTAEVTSGKEKSSLSSFLAELALQDGKWLVVSVEESDLDPLEDLAWLVGSWKDDGTGPSIASTFAWDAGGRSLVRKYSITEENGEQKSGTQYIVWDSGLGQIRSWVFSSSGTVGQGEWEQHEDRWAIHWTATLADGRPASATQVITPVDEDSFQVEWTDIDIDGDMRPSTDKIIVRRVVAASANSEGTPHE